MKRAGEWIYQNGKTRIPAIIFQPVDCTREVFKKKNMDKKFCFLSTYILALECWKLKTGDKARD